MLAGLVRWAIRFRAIVVVLAGMLLLYGGYVLTRAEYDVFPEFAPPQVVIQTEAPGLAPEHVEVLVSQPIENAVAGIPGIDALRSASIQGLSVVTVAFDPATDVYRDRQGVAERLSSVRLPEGLRAPVMTPLTSSTSTILVAGLTSDTVPLMDLRTAADWTIRPRLLAVPGVAKVSVFGAEARQLQVRVDPERLVRFGLGLGDLLVAARGASGVRGAGFLENDNQRIVLQSEGQSLTPQEIARTAIATHDGGVVRIGNVADVLDAPEPPIGAASIGGRPAVLLVVAQQYGANTLVVTRAAGGALEALRPGLEKQGVTLHPDLFRPARFIETATGSVRSALLLGGLLVVAVLVLFLLDWRTAAISCATIPLSLLSAIIVLDRLGLSLNTMTLGGLAIAIGVVVDDAVIDVENIVRRLRENLRRESPLPPSQVALAASLEVRSAVVYATFAVILVFVPVLTLPGLAGRLFAPLGLAYILAVLASLGVALTVTPALCLILLPRHVAEQAPPVMRWSKGGYRALLERVERHPRPVLLGVAALAGVAVAALPFFGGAFLPELKEGHFIVHMAAVPGTSLAESLRTGRGMTEALMKLPFVRSVAQQVGRAEKADDVWGPHYSEIHVDLKPLGGAEAERAAGALRRALSPFLGVNVAVKTFLTERAEEILSGYTASVVVNVFGSDLDGLDRAASEIARELSDVRGAADVQVQAPPGMPQLGVRLRKAELARWGFTPVEVLDGVRAAYQGEVVGQVFDGPKAFDVAVILAPQSRRRPTSVGELPLRSGAGTYVRLRQLADIYEAAGRYQVLHQGGRRVQTVTANVVGRDVASFVEEARQRVSSEVTLPAGYEIEVGGTAEAQSRSRRDLLVHSLLAGAGILILLAMVARNLRNLLLVLANLPFALVGGVLAAFAAGGTLSLGSLVGFVTLFGMTLRNSVLMVSHFEHLVEVEGQEWGVLTAIQGATDRLAPILMTSLVTALGLLPLALGRNAPGREIEGPMAVVILGGLMTSMVLTLLALPTLALRYARFAKAADE